MRLITSNPNGTRPSEPIQVKQTTTPTLMTTPEGELLTKIGFISKFTDNFTRPANTDQYAVNDEVSDDAAGLWFQNVTKDGEAGSAYIVKARLEKSTSSVTAASFRLWLFNTDPSMVGDNEPFTIGNNGECQGYIDFTFDSAGAQVAFGTFCGGGGPLGFYTPDGDIYGVLVAKDTYTPGSGEVFTAELTVDQN